MFSYDERHIYESEYSLLYIYRYSAVFRYKHYTYTFHLNIYLNGIFEQR